MTKRHSHAGTRTRVGEVKTRYPNRLDYMGFMVSLDIANFHTTPRWLSQSLQTLSDLNANFMVGEYGKGSNEM